MRNREAYAAFEGDLWIAMAVLQNQYRQNRTMAERVAHGSDENVETIVLGDTVRILHNEIVDYSPRLAGFFEISLDADSWYGDLVKKMTGSIEDLQPALMPRSASSQRLKLRAFRQVFASSTTRRWTRQGSVRPVDTCSRWTTVLRPPIRRFFVGKSPCEARGAVTAACQSTVACRRSIRGRSPR